MPRVLRIINRFNLGGITYNVSYLSKFMPATYQTVLIGGPEEKGEESSLFIPHSMGLQPLIVPEMRRSLHPLSDFFAYRSIKRLLLQHRPQIVHTHASKAGALGRLAAIHAGVPVIVHTFHGHVFKGYFGKLKTQLFIRIERYLAKKSTAIVAISALQKHELCSIYKVCPSSKTHIIPLGFDLRRFTIHQLEKRASFRTQFALPEATLAIGIIGRLAPIKHHELFIDAIEVLSLQTQRAFKAFIIGEGEIRSALENYLATKPKRVQSNVVLTGWIKEVDTALAGLDIVCLSSKNEGTPVSLIEAQAAGKFIVSTNVGGIADILHPDCGLLSEPEDKEKFIANLCLAVQNFEIFQSKAGTARKHVLEAFSYERLCKDMDALYRSLLGPTSA